MPGPFQIAAIGEAVWDQYPTERYPGGTAVNFARHLRQLGHHAAVLSRVGDDEPGRAICRALADEDIDTSGIQIDPEYPTGGVQISYAADGKTQFRCRSDCAFDHFGDFTAWFDERKRLDALLFSVFSQRHPASRSEIQAILRDRPARLILFDADQTANYEGLVECWRFGIGHCDVVKLSRATWPPMQHALGLRASDEITFLRELVTRFSLTAACMTLAERGVLAVSEAKAFYQPGWSVATVDPIGAGDAFMSGLTAAMMADRAVPRALVFACALASQVCTHEGAFRAYDPGIIAGRDPGHSLCADQRFVHLIADPSSLH